MNAYLKDTGIEPDRVRGQIVTTDGRTLGEHEGVHRFTVGQRKGLGIAAPEPLYVIATDPATQRVVVGSNDDLLRQRFFVNEVNWIAVPRVEAPTRAWIKIRNKHNPAAATLHPTADDCRVEAVFDEPQRAVTPGQGAVFYDLEAADAASPERVLGGGWIE